jgi:diguanylate cyclase (GGDEF)-like protein/PAS domain S-box-containing protein
VPITLLLEPSGFATLLLAFANVLAAIAVLTAAGITYRRSGRSVATLLFAACCAALTVWLVSRVVLSLPVRMSTAVIAARIGHALLAVVPAALCHLTAIVTRQSRKLRAFVITAWSVAGVAAIVSLATPLFVLTPLAMPDGHWLPRYSYANLGWILAVAAMIFASARLLFRLRRRSDGELRRRCGALLIALGFLVAAAVDFLPSMGVPVPPLGFIAITAFAILSARAMARFDLDDLTPGYAASQILETMKGAVLVVDLKGKIRVANKAANAMMGYSDVGLVGEPIRVILDPEENLTTGQLLNSMGVIEQTMIWRTASGARIDVTTHSSFVRDGDGTPVGVVYVAADVTERKRAEAALRESEQRYRMLFDANPLPMWVFDVETLQFRSVNDAAVRHYGYSREGFLRMKITDIRPEEDIPLLKEQLRIADSRQGVRPFRHRLSDGSIIDVDISSFELLLMGRRARLVIAVDTTMRNQAEQLLRQSEESYRGLFENASDFVYTHALDGGITSMNRAGERLTGYTSEEVMGMPFDALIAPDHRDTVHEMFRRKVAGEVESTAYEIEMLSRSGQRIAAEINSTLITRNGEPAGVQGIARDLRERLANEQRMQLLFERNLAGVYRGAIGGEILECNDACARIFGFTNRYELIGTNARHLFHDAEENARFVSVIREQKSVTNVELRLRRRDGTSVWVLVNMSLLEDQEPSIIEGTLIDITDRKSAQEQIEYQAYHDDVTGLPNRLLFRDRITVALAHAKRTGLPVAVMFLDLDQFKLVNDTLGHTVGDGLLKVIATRLSRCVRAEDTVARMGGDEFTILLAEVTDPTAAATVAQKVLDLVSQPIVVEEHELFVTTSIGIAVYPSGGADAETLLKNADRAMYRAKELGRNNYQYVDQLGDDSGRLTLESGLHRAFERDEFIVHYQPMMDIVSGRMAGAEALIRWQHPVRGLLQPEQFIPVAEQSRMILPIGEWVLRTACAQMKRWHDAGHHPMRIAVNLSARQFQQRDLAQIVERVLEETGLPPDSLELEITESAAMQNVDLSIAVMRRLKEMGIRIAIDDFGTGYSSLSYLKRFPIDTVKIDQNFLRDMTSESADGAIVSAVISLARALKLRVIAEGVETQQQLAFLQSHQCEEMQGFLFSRPMSAMELEATLTRGPM